MEPRKDEKTTEVRKEAKPSRFRIDKLEERIAPNKGGIPRWEPFVPVEIGPLPAGG